MGRPKKRMAPLRGRVKPTALVLLSLASGILAGCADDRPDYNPNISAADSVANVTNPFYTLRPGMTWQ